MNTLAPGTALALWTGGDLASVLDAKAIKLLEQTQCQYVMPHGGPDRLIAALPSLARHARAIVPNARLLVGIGCDWWSGQAMAGNGAKAERVLEEAVDLAADLGAVGIFWDSEVDNNGAAAVALAHDLVKSTRAAHPDIVQVHTDTDHPGSHSQYPWEEWLGPDGCDVECPQVYVANDPKIAMQPRGALQAREASAIKSYAAATHAGWMRPDLWGQAVYLQVHGTPAEDLIEVGARYPLRALWTSSLVDDAGTTAAIALSKLSRLGLSLEKFQASVGLQPDGVCGKLTMAALETAP